MRRTYGLLLCFLFAIDRLTKTIVLLVYPDNVLLNRKTLFFIQNAEFSFLLFLIFVLLLIGWFMHEVSRTARMTFVASGATFMVAGAASNFFDTHIYGGVIDWIALPGLTVFNLADVWILVGCVFVVISCCSRKRYTEDSTKISNN